MSKHCCPPLQTPRPAWLPPVRQPPSRMDQPLPAQLRGLSLRAPSAADATCTTSCSSAASGRQQRSLRTAAAVSAELRQSADTAADSSLAEADTAHAAEAGAVLRTPQW